MTDGERPTGCLATHIHHVAAGTNFPEHAGEVAVEDGPFLFPKLTRPTAWDAPVPAGDGLLDHEVELAWVSLADLADGDALETAGLVLANDYTDRDTLLGLLDPGNVASGVGFATGKSFPGYLPVGSLVVVPRDLDAFTADLELRLYVNGELRQRGTLDEMIWDVDEIVARTWRWRDRTWDHRGTAVALLPSDGVIPARTLIMSGTPRGTVFAGVDLPRRVDGFVRWLALGWDRSIPRRSIESYVAAARDAGVYLQPGDRVTIRVDRLGVVDNVVVP